MTAGEGFEPSTYCSRDSRATTALPGIGATQTASIILDIPLPVKSDRQGAASRFQGRFCSFPGSRCGSQRMRGGAARLAKTPRASVSR